MKEQKIRERMDVMSLCGRHIGTVDRIDSGLIKLTSGDPRAGIHFIPLPLGHPGIAGKPDGQHSGAVPNGAGQSAQYR